MKLIIEKEFQELLDQKINILATDIILYRMIQSIRSGKQHSCFDNETMNQYEMIKELNNSAMSALATACLNRIFPSTDEEVF